VGFPDAGGAAGLADMSGFVVRAPAKLNLGLEILGRRDDGFHEIRTVFQSVAIFDRLRLEPASDDELVCSSPGLDQKHNLAWRAVELIRRRTGIQSRVRIDLAKEIPTGAGLGGASSDAAAALRGAAALWSLNASAADLAPLAAELGSDVSFFLTGGTMLAQGRGEMLTPLPPLTDAWFVIASPSFEFPNKTARLYGALTASDFTSGASVAAIASTIASGDSVDWHTLQNGFDGAASRIWPELGGLRDAFRFAGAPFIAMTGAGPSHYTATNDRARAEAIAARLSYQIGPQTRLFVCQPLPAAPPVEAV
jgi:4-diphosphocytidyl-2-C-methyl-D-erythritol kinase